MRSGELSGVLIWGVPKTDAGTTWHKGRGLSLGVVGFSLADASITQAWIFGFNSRAAHECMFMMMARSDATPHVSSTEVVHMQTIRYHESVRDGSHA